MLYLRKFFRWHLLLWLAYCGYEVLGDYLFGVPTHKQLWLQGAFILSRIVTFYFCYLLVLPRLLRAGRLPLLALGLAGTVLVATGVRAGLEEGLYPLLLGFRNYDPGTRLSVYLFDGLYYAIPTMALAGALWAGETALRRKRENQQLAADKRAAELAFLKTQINPHFLYNTLNMLYGLAYGVDKPLAGGLLKLSELLRYMLREPPGGLVSLDEEVAYLHNFLALYRLRYPGRLHAELRVTGEPAGYRVAPLLLIPLVENAFKHGVLDDPATPVRLRLTLAADTIDFTVENQRHDHQADPGSGIGLANLRRRLELLYPGRHTVAAGPAGPQFRAHLRLSGLAVLPTPPAAASPAAPVVVAAAAA